MNDFAGVGVGCSAAFAKPPDFGVVCAARTTAILGWLKICLKFKILRFFCRSQKPDTPPDFLSASARNKREGTKCQRKPRHPKIVWGSTARTAPRFCGGATKYGGQHTRAQVAPQHPKIVVVLQRRSVVAILGCSWAAGAAQFLRCPLQNRADFRQHTHAQLFAVLAAGTNPRRDGYDFAVTPQNRGGFSAWRKWWRFWGARGQHTHAQLFAVLAAGTNPRRDGYDFGVFTPKSCGSTRAQVAPRHRKIVRISRTRRRWTAAARHPKIVRELA